LVRLQWLDYYPYINCLKWLKPGTPILNDPSYLNSDGNYSLNWFSTVRTIGYILEEDNSPFFDSPTEIYNGSSISFNILRKANGTYYYRVKAYNEKYSSSWSNIVDIIVDWPPNIPKNLIVSTYSPGNTLNLFWKLNIIDTKEYILEYKNETIVDWEQFDPIIHPGFTFNHTGLIDGEKNYYRIQARDHRGQLSNFSEIIYGIPWDSVPPASPTGLRVISTTNDSISLKWNPNTENDLEGYHLFRSKVSNSSVWGGPLGTIPKGIEDYIDTGLEEETTYYYVLTAFDEVPNNSSYSNIAFGTTIFGLHGPVINNSVKDFSIPEDTIDDSTIKLYYWFMDINNDPLEFKCEGNENISVAIFQENGTVILIPKKNWNGKETLIFYASDGFSNISDFINVTVTPVNDPPGPAIIISPQNGQEFENGTEINFSAICFDSDIVYGDKLTFEWSSNLSGKFGQEASSTVIFLKPGKHEIILNVTDIAGELSIDRINITILSKSIYDNMTNETRPEQPETNESKNDTKPEKGQRSYINTVIFGTFIVIIIAIVILVVFLFSIKKKQESKKDMSETKKDQLELIQLNRLPEPRQQSQSIELQMISIEQPQVSVTPETSPQKSNGSVTPEQPGQETNQSDLGQQIEPPKQVNDHPSETPKAPLGNQD